MFILYPGRPACSCDLLSLLQVSEYHFRMFSSGSYSCSSRPFSMIGGACLFRMNLFKFPLTKTILRSLSTTSWTRNWFDYDDCIFTEIYHLASLIFPHLGSFQEIFFNLFTLYFEHKPTVDDNVRLKCSSSG